MRVGAATAEAHALAVQADGQFVVAGSAFADPGGAGQFALVRVNDAGLADPTFGNAGIVLTPIGTSGAEARAIALQADGRILIAGTSFASDEAVLVRYAADGSLDAAFGRQGIVVSGFGDRVAALLVQPDGKILVAGSKGGHQAALALARFNSNGAPDLAFGSGGNVSMSLESSAQPYAAALQPDGAIVVAGGVGTADSGGFLLARYRANGDLDSGFGAHGLVTMSFDGGSTGAHGVSVLPDGKIVAVGAGNGRFAVVRYLPDGTRDRGFGNDGVLLTTVGDAGSTPSGLAVQADGKVVTTGVTYFLVPTPGPNWLVVAVLVLVISMGGLLVAVALRRTQRRTGRGPGPSQPPRPAA
jgi:uncharacterized delta-60 repeat protein